MSQSETVAKVWQELMQNSTNPRQQQSLERIKRACDYLEEQGLKISAGSVERYCTDHDWDGPKAQSIRNSPVLKKLLELRQSSQILRRDRKANKPMMLIPDETVRAYVAMLEEERDQAIADRTRIMEGLRSIPGVPVDNFLRVGFGGVAISAPPAKAKPEISPTLREAVCRLLNPTLLADCGMSLERERLRQKTTNNILLEKQHVTALRILVSADDDKDVR
ncbi:hypothetical protein ABIA48_001848 [Pseudomonas sp. S30_BP2TU TE3576]|uniref:hypothetical protein n=1 Tax=Pseudomonas sp. S30_BP2TU TE3576 TaxID=3349329 RepID=UPI003D23AA79